MDTNPNQLEINATFKTEINSSRTDGGIFTQKKSDTVAVAVVSKLKDTAGNYITLSDYQQGVFRAMFYPTNELRMNVISATLKDAGVELDETTQSLLLKLMNPAGIQKALEAMEKPEKKTIRDFLS